MKARSEARCVEVRLCEGLAKLSVRWERRLRQKSRQDAGGTKSEGNGYGGVNGNGDRDG